MLQFIRFSWRLTRLGWHVIAGVLIISCLFRFYSLASRQRCIQRWSGKLVRICAVKVQLCGSLPPANENARLLVANHVSWIDIFALHELLPLCFVAKSEVRSWPVLGWLADRAGSLFIERGNRQHTKVTANAVVDALQAGRAIAVFPEGTTSDGSDVLPFKSSLFQVVCDTKVAILPIVLRYEDEAGNLCRDAAYYGDVTMWQTLRFLLTKQQTLLRLHVLPTIAAADANRRSLCLAAEQQMHSYLVDLNQTTALPTAAINN